MKQLFENWRKHLNEAAVPHSANHIVKKMKKTGKSAMETLKSLTTDLSDEEAKRWLERHKDEMESAKQDLDEAAYEPDRAGTFDIDTGEEHLSPEDLMRDEVQDLADKFNVEASVEIASDGKLAILVSHQNEDGETTVYNDAEEMYQDLASRQEMSEGIENITPENIQIAAEAFKQVAMNLAPAVVLPALMMAYRELKLNKNNKETHDEN